MNDESALSATLGSTSQPPVVSQPKDTKKDTLPQTKSNLRNKFETLKISTSTGKHDQEPSTSKSNPLPIKRKSPNPYDFDDEEDDYGSGGHGLSSSQGSSSQVRVLVLLLTFVLFFVLFCQEKDYSTFGATSFLSFKFILQITVMDFTKD